jgi:hypothetical protein
MMLVDEVFTARMTQLGIMLPLVRSPMAGRLLLYHLSFDS